jgi:hypothetical protein
MAIRVQVILPEPDWELFRRQAAREGLSLSAWFREAARERLKKSHTGPSIQSVEDLRAFFEACDERELGQEPDWDEHLEVISRSKRTGDSGT